MSKSDAALLEAWGAGDADAGNRLFDRYFLPVSRFFANKVPEEHDDLIQETFAGCLKGRDRLRDKDSFRSYVFAVASNVLRMHFRRKRTRGPAVEIDECSAHDLAPGPSTVLRAADQQQTLLDALRRLPLPLQIVTELYYWEGMRTHEIGEAVDLPTGTVRSHLRRGRALLLDAMQDPHARGDDSALDDLDRWAHEVRETVTRSCA
ncbi:MAG: sigma-70 family RNA polymerase sigma factor [Myxococcota bacterium]